MRFTVLKANKAYAVAVITGMAAVVAAHRDASAQVKWCGYSGGSTECTYDSEAQCRQSHRDCLPRP